MAATTSSAVCATDVPRGRTEPRLWTRPLVEGPAGPCGCGCALTDETSYGFEFVDFVVGLGLQLLPWQRWLAIHAGELLPDGRPRFRKILVLVARQNGKTHLLALLALYWLFVVRPTTILGTSTKLEYAQDSWEKAVSVALASPQLLRYLPAKHPHGVRRTNGSVWLKTLDRCEYRIAPANEEGGRSKTIGLAILDELRQQHDYSAWDAVVPATNAVRFAQVWALSNMGGDRSVVLNDQRDIALQGADPRLGIFEWSAPAGSDPTDPDALCQANPSVGYLQDLDVLQAEGAAAALKGGDKLAGFLTEILCIRVRNLDPAVDPDGWSACRVPGSLDGVSRRQLALCVDVSLDGQHVALLAAAKLEQGLVRVETVDAWDGPDAVRVGAAGVRDYVERIRPRMFGWLPGGPAAALAADLSARRRGPGARSWPPRGVRVEEIKTEVPAVCMGFAGVVAGRQLLHSAGEDEGLDQLLEAHVIGAEKLWTGDVWRFTRRGGGRVSAAYAAAGAVHLALAMPTTPGPAGVVLPSGVSAPR